MEQFCETHPGTVGCGGAGSESAAGSSGLSAEASEGSSGASSGGSNGGSGGKSGGGSGILGEIHRMITDHIGGGASGAGAHSGSESESEGSAGSEGSEGSGGGAKEDGVAKKKLAAIAAIVQEARSKAAKEEAQKVKDKMAKLEEMADQLIAQGGKGSGREGGSGSEEGSGSSCCGDHGDHGDHSSTTEMTSEASEEHQPVVAEGGEAPKE
jgi:hypothetical protein